MVSMRKCHENFCLQKRPLLASAVDPIDIGIISVLSVLELRDVRPACAKCEVVGRATARRNISEFQTAALDGERSLDSANKRLTFPNRAGDWIDSARVSPATRRRLLALRSDADETDCMAWCAARFSGDPGTGNPRIYNVTEQRGGKTGRSKIQRTEQTTHVVPQALGAGALVLGVVLIGAGLYQRR